MSLADPRRALLTYLLGGTEQTRTREQGLAELVHALRALRDNGVEMPDGVLEGVSIEPPYFNALAETVTRMLRRPRDTQRVLRYLEWWGQAQVGLDGPSVAEALGPVYGDYTRKLVSDIGRMCFSAAGLDKSWLQIAARAGNEAFGTETEEVPTSAGANDEDQSQLALESSSDSSAQRL
jgi:hypothetical protein